MPDTHHDLLPGAAPISFQDAAWLRTNPSPEVRAGIAAKVGAKVAEGSLAAGAERIALEILERFAGDAELAVRTAVAEQFRRTERLPADVARRLALDVEQVAAPVLESFPGFDDGFLVSVIGRMDFGKMRAIAGRKTVSAVVAEALADLGDVATVTRLVENAGAAIEPPALDRIAERHGGVPAVANPLALRPGLPSSIAWKLLGRVSAAIAQEMAEQHGIPPALAGDFAARGQEVAAMLMIRPRVAEGAHLRGFLSQLQADRKLTPALLFRGLCSGDVEFFLCGLAVRTGSSTDTMRMLVLGGGRDGVRDTLDRARIPFAHIAPFRTALEVLAEWRGPLEAGQRLEFQLQVLGAVFSTYGRSADPEVRELLNQVFDERPPTGSRRVA